VSTAEADATLSEGLKRLRGEYQGLMNKLSSKYSKPKSRYIFLINNTDLVLSLFEEQKVKSESAQSAEMSRNHVAFFDEALAGHIAAYIDHELTEHFSELMSFVREGTRGVSHSQKRARAVLREFTANWRVGMSHIQDNIRREFPNFRNGQAILTRTFAELLSLHKRSLVVADEIDPTLKRDVVATASLVFEIRKYTENLD